METLQGLRGPPRAHKHLLYDPMIPSLMLLLLFQVSAFLSYLKLQSRPLLLGFPGRRVCVLFVERTIPRLLQVLPSNSVMIGVSLPMAIHNP